MTVKSMVLKKYYLLAGMMMTANIFVVNEVRAMEAMKMRAPQRNKTSDNSETNKENLFNSDIIPENNNTDVKDEEITSKMNNKIHIQKNNRSSNVEDIYDIRDKHIKKENNKSVPILQILIPVSGFILSWENSINFTVGSALSLANKYFKWWDYNKGGYWKLGCLGWRSGRFANGIFQFDINLNLGRGFSWLIPGLCNFISMLMIDNNDFEEGFEKADLLLSYFCSSFLFYNIGGKKKKGETISDDTLGIIAFGIVFCLQGFVSMPLVIHISTFDFTIALDSLIWGGVGFLPHLGDNTEKEKDKLIEKPIDEKNN